MRRKGLARCAATLTDRDQLCRVRLQLARVRPAELQPSPLARQIQDAPVTRFHIEAHHALGPVDAGRQVFDDPLQRVERPEFVAADRPGLERLVQAMAFVVGMLIGVLSITLDAIECLA
jgi:hypothetical protein